MKTERRDEQESLWLLTKYQSQDRISQLYERRQCPGLVHQIRRSDPAQVITAQNCTLIITAGLVGTWSITAWNCSRGLIIGAIGSHCNDFSALKTQHLFDIA